MTISNFGQKKYDTMMEQIDDPDKIALTHDTVLPKFIENAVAKIQENNTVLV